MRRSLARLHVGGHCVRGASSHSSADSGTDSGCGRHGNAGSRSCGWHGRNGDLRASGRGDAIGLAGHGAGRRNKVLHSSHLQQCNKPGQQAVM